MIEFILGLYLASYVAIFGLTFAFFDRQFAIVRDTVPDYVFATGFSTFAALLGPVGVLLVYFLSGRAKHGWHIC